MTERNIGMPVLIIIPVVVALYHCWGMSRYTVIYKLTIWPNCPDHLFRITRLVGIKTINNMFYLVNASLSKELAWPSGCVMDSHATARGSIPGGYGVKSELSFTSFARDSNWGCRL